MANTRKATPSEASTRVSRRTSTSRVSVNSPPVRAKTRGLSTASLDSSESNASGATLKPNGVNRSPNATHAPAISPAVKRMSTSIPTPISRRQSMHVQPSNGSFKSELSSSNSFSQVMRKISSPPSGLRPRHVTTSTLPPASLLEESFPLQEPITIAPSTPRNRLSSYTPPRKANTLDSAPSPKPKASPKPSPSPQKTPAKKIDTPKSVSSTPPWSPLNTLDRRNGKAVAKSLASESPSRAPAQSVRGGEVFPMFDAVLDGDDMTLELVTELDEGEVDEDVSVT
jgi:pyrimidine and pyridine-specific 5'-nucleotidase